MTRLYLVKTNGGDVLGWGSNDSEYLRRLGDGEVIECDTRKVRNPAHHRKFMALVGRALLGQSQYTKTQLLVELKLRCEWYDEHVTHTGKLVYVPRSISFATMDQEQFEPFYNTALVELAKMFPDNSLIVDEADNIIARSPSLDFAGQPLEDLPIG